jgi:hypothetical protein
MYGGAGDDLFNAGNGWTDYLDGGDGTDCIGSKDDDDTAVNFED